MTLLNVRLLSEQREASLSPFAGRSQVSGGRLRAETLCPIRTVFQRDRDRIIYSNSFRRLKHKTQVFIAPLDDHYVTRLTHTLEVVQVARTLSRALNLNEDLTEAIALGHDLGHTPFGHVGEQVLDELYEPGFQHAEQSLRLVDVLENNGRGLNLTHEVREGIAGHSKSRGEVLGAAWGELGTLEAEVVRLADLVAFINHDIDDAIRAAVISDRDLPLQAVRVLGMTRGQRVGKIVEDAITSSWAARGEDPEGGKSRPRVMLSEEVLGAVDVMREFLFERVYDRSAASPEHEAARRTLAGLYGHFHDHEEALPPDYRQTADDLSRRVVDYVAGMTDRYATNLAQQLGVS